MCLLTYKHIDLSYYKLSVRHQHRLGHTCGRFKPQGKHYYDNKLQQVYHNMGYSKRRGGSYEGRRGHGKGFKRCPVELGEELEVDITELSAKNEGVAKIQGYLVHVPDAKPGDRVKIKIVKVGAKAAYAGALSK